MKRKPLQVKTKSLSTAELNTLNLELAAKPMDLRTYVATTKNVGIAFKLLKENTAALRDTMF